LSHLAKPAYSSILDRHQVLLFSFGAALETQSQCNFLPEATPSHTQQSELYKIELAWPLKPVLGDLPPQLNAPASTAPAGS
jgi:hypothetical protein